MRENNFKKKPSDLLRLSIYNGEESLITNFTINLRHYFLYDSLYWHIILITYRHNVYSTLLI